MTQNDYDFIAESPENYEQKCLCALVLDVSASMHGQPISELNSHSPPQIKIFPYFLRRSSRQHYYPALGSTNTPGFTPKATKYAF